MRIQPVAIALLLCMLPPGISAAESCPIGGMREASRCVYTLKNGDLFTVSQEESGPYWIRHALTLRTPAEGDGEGQTEPVQVEAFNPDTKSIILNEAELVALTYSFDPAIGRLDAMYRSPPADYYYQTYALDGYRLRLLESRQKTYLEPCNDDKDCKTKTTFVYKAHAQTH